MPGHGDVVAAVFVGIGSVVMWRLSEQQGHGDLRVYLFVQLYPMAAVPLTGTRTFRSRPSSSTMSALAPAK